MNITLKDGSVKVYDAPMTAADITKDISMGLYRAACCCRIDGQVRDLRTTVSDDCAFEVLTFDEEDGRRTFNHTASHIMAQAVKRLYPQVKLTIGPAIENGFYYDFDCGDTPFTTDDLLKIEAEMKKIVKENPEIERFELPPAEATALMEEKGEPYKVELIAEHAGKGEHISFYKQGEFTELCAGPHLMSIAAVKAFKLTNTTGAYWRGDAQNKMLCRVYGTAFPKASMLEAHLQMLEEAKRLDISQEELEKRKCTVNEQDTTALIFSQKHLEALYLQCLMHRRNAMQEIPELKGLSETCNRIYKLQDVDVLFQCLLMDQMDWEEEKLYVQFSTIYLLKQTVKN